MSFDFIADSQGSAGLVTEVPGAPGPVPDDGAPTASAGRSLGVTRHAIGAQGTAGLWAHRIISSSIPETVAVVATAIGSHAVAFGVQEPWNAPQIAVAVLAAGLTAWAFGPHRADAHDGQMRPRGLARTGRAWADAFGMVLLILVLLAGARRAGLTALPVLPMAESADWDWIFLWLAGTLALLAAGHGWGALSRSGADGRTPSAAARGTATRVVIVGTGPEAQCVLDHWWQRHDNRVAVIGVVDERPWTEGNPPVSRMPLTAGDGSPVPMLGDPDCLGDLVRRSQIDMVVVALPWDASSRIAAVLKRLVRLPIAVRLAPDLTAFQYVRSSVSRLGGVPMLHMHDRPLTATQSRVKRIEDVVVASACLTLFAPLMLLIAAAIKLDSPGPVLFRQQRQGLHGDLIRVLKFRTMRQSMTDAHAVQQTVRHDKRVTRVGRLLRRTSLDEVPQFLNVLLGDMSIVGPRPHALATKAAGRLFEEVVADYAARHQVKPGITGWAQINGWRGETDTTEKIERRVEFDLFYIRNWSLRLDLAIILKTVSRLVADDGAY